MAKKQGKTPTKISELIPDPKNFNKHTPYGMGLLEKSIRKFGFMEAGVISEDNVIASGNARQETAVNIGMDEVQIIDIDGTKPVYLRKKGLKSGTPEFHELALALNQVGQANVVMDCELIEATVGEAVCEEWGIELPENEVTDDGFDAEPPLNPITVLGDVYELNQHRLICGDATDGETWAKLGPDKTMICFTSPPYNVSGNAALVGNTHAAKRKSLYQEDSDSVIDYIQLLNHSLTNAINYTGGVAFNVQPLANNKVDLLKWIANFSQNFNDIIVWNKSQAAPAMAKGVLSAAYEWIVIFSDKQTRSIPLSSWRGSLSNVYNAPPQRNNEFSQHHAATFPIHLPRFIIVDLMNRCSGVVDCFMGTGTTLMASEQLGRKSYGIEKGPGYCDIIIARFIKYKLSSATERSFTIKRNGKELSEKEIAKYLKQIEPRETK